MNIEDVFSSRLRMKIMRIVEQVGELNVSEIARRLRVNYKTVNDHLIVLEEEGLLKHKLYGRVRLYSLDERSPKTRAVRDLLQTWEHANKL